MLPIATSLALLISAGATVPSEEPLRFLLGNWRVVSKDPAGGDDLHVCYSVQSFVGEKWLSGVATSKTPGFGSKDVWGYDRASGELMRTVFDASGTYAVVRSSGWAGDTLVLRGDARSAGGTLQVRETIRRLNENKFNATWEALRDGKWSPYAIETATRVNNDTCNAS